MIEELGLDLRHAVRMLAKQLGFTFVATLMLAVGIGANVAIFSLASEIFLRSAPGIPAADRLVALGRSTGGESFEGFGHLSYLRYREQTRSFTGLAASRNARLLWKHDEGTVVLDGQLVSGNYFTVLGVPMVHGRGFLPEEDHAPGVHPVMVLSHAAWTSRFGADPAIAGRRLRVGDTEFTVVGVTAKGFRGLGVAETVDAWVPLMMESQLHPPFPVLNSDFFHSLGIVGRLKPDVTLAQARAELEVLAASIERPVGTPAQRRRVVVTPHVSLPEPGWRAYAVSVLMLLSMVTGLVLLIACANVGGLLLARATARRREIAVRIALGATRGRIVRQLLAEALVLASVSALAGLLLSYGIMTILRARTDEHLVLGIDGTVLLFVMLLVFFTAVASGLGPALQATRTDVLTSLKEDHGRRSGRPWLRDALVVAQVAVSLVLLAGAGLFIQTLRNAGSVDVGFDTGRLWLVGVDLRLAGYAEARSRTAYRTLAGEIAIVSGVQSVSRSSTLPRYGNFMHGNVEIETEDRQPNSSGRVRVEHNEVGAGFFETLRLPVVRGRGITALDDSTAPRVGVVNEAMARQLWPGTDAIGKRLRFVRLMGLSQPLEIVGVVRDSRTLVLESQVRPEIFVPINQNPRDEEIILVRLSTGADEAKVVAGIAQEVRRLDAGLPPARIESFRQRMRSGLSDQRLYAEWTALFGAVGLLLAVIGLYASLSFAVSQRSREIGIRMALGADRGRVMRVVMRDGLLVAGTGIVAGLLVSLAATRLIASLLYGVGATDSLSFGAAIALMLFAAALACWVPAQRATRVDPLVALRHE